MPRVMISGWTLNTPMPMPLIVPAMTAAPRPMRIATTWPWPVDWVATRNAAIDAIVPTERSMPPVSIASVWQPARIASGIAARIAMATQLGLRVPGWTSSRTMTSATSSAVSGISG